MTKLPSVSIIIPFFNRADLLEKAVRSVLAQKRKDWELLLVDDHSSDGSAETALQFAASDQRIKYLRRNRDPKGASTCRNMGADAARGEFLIFLDSDDLLAPYCIERRLEEFEKNRDLDFLVFPMLLFRNEIEDMRVLQNIPTSESDLDRFLSRENVWLMSSPIWKKSSFEKLGGFTEIYLSYQDWEINVRALIASFRYRFVADLPPDHFYRQHAGPTISSNRFTPQHNSSNAEMIINTFLSLKDSGKVTEQRRLALAGFLTDVLLRFSFVEQPSRYTGTVKDFLRKALDAGLISRAESSLIKAFFRLHIFKASYVFPPFRKMVDIIFKKQLLKEFFVPHSSNQLKHKYNGSLA